MKDMSLRVRVDYDFVRESILFFPGKITMASMAKTRNSGLDSFRVIYVCISSVYLTRAKFGQLSCQIISTRLLPKNKQVTCSLDRRHAEISKSQRGGKIQ